MGRESARMVRIKKGPVQLTTRTTRAGETRKFWDKGAPTTRTERRGPFTSAGAAPPRPARARAGALAPPSGAGGPPAPGGPAPARRRSRAPARAPGAAGRLRFFGRRQHGARRARRRERARGPRRASREGPGPGRGRACVSDSWSREGDGTRFDDARPAAARPARLGTRPPPRRGFGSGPGPGLARRRARGRGPREEGREPGLRLGRDVRGRDAGGSAAVRARLGGARPSVKAPEHEMGRLSRLATHGGPAAPGQHTVAACCGCCDGNGLRAFGCGWQGVRLPLKWGPRCCGRALGRSLTRAEDSSRRRRTTTRPATCLGDAC